MCTDKQKDCRHAKVFAPYTLMSNPPQYPWICKECGLKGVDTGACFAPDLTYQELCDKFAAEGTK